jgi:IgA Peptidase M64
VGTSDGQVIGMTKVVDHGDPALRWNMVILGDGYQSNQIAQFASDVTNFANTMQGTDPFGELWAGINVYRIDVASTDSGAADPVACGGTGATPHTYFDASFCNNGIQRLLEVNNATVHSVVNASLPQAHMIMVLVNSPVYGGSGGDVAVVSLAPSAVEIALHEMGHTAFGFADEYEYYAGCGVDAPGTHDRYTGAEPGQPNITATAKRKKIKWKSLVVNTTRMPTTRNRHCSQCDTQANPFPPATVGAYEGAGYYHCGLYRPQFDCRMRALGNPFCAVCQGVIRQVIGPHLPVAETIAVA